MLQTITLTNSMIKPRRENGIALNLMTHFRTEAIFIGKMICLSMFK